MKTEFIVRPWGYFVVLYKDSHTWVKRLVVNPHSALSLQKHGERSEVWSPQAAGLVAIIGDDEYDLSPGELYYVPQGVQHRISNPCDEPLSVLELALGRPDEDDIVRIRDEYGRV